MALLHRAGGGFALTRRNALSVEGWATLVEACRSRADTVLPGLADEIASELAGLRTAWPGDLPAGIIHADLFPDNVFFLGDRLSGVIDFYFACNDMLAYDIAVGLNAWCFEQDVSFNVTKARGLLAGYQRVRPLTAPEVAALPLLARGAAFRFLLTRLVDWLNVPPGALVVPKDPLEYWQKLRFHRKALDAGAYGIAA